jgi:acyl-CoA thioester hydrolase
MARSDFAFAFPFRVRYSEIDGQGIVFNAHYLTFYDTAITEYMRWLPFDYPSMVKRGMDSHTVRTVVEYKRPIPYDAEIDVCVRAAKLGRSSATFLLEIHPKGGDALYATGEVVWVNADQTTHKSAPWLPDFVDALVKREGAKIERKA